MSIRREQYYALLKTRDFLYACLTPQTRPKGARALKEAARACLRHFPFLTEQGEPMFSQDNLEWGRDQLDAPAQAIGRQAVPEPSDAPFVHAEDCGYTVTGKPNNCSCNHPVT